MYFSLQIVLQLLLPKNNGKQHSYDIVWCTCIYHSLISKVSTSIYMQQIHILDMIFTQPIQFLYFIVLKYIVSLFATQTYILHAHIQPAAQTIYPYHKWSGFFFFFVRYVHFRLSSYPTILSLHLHLASLFRLSLYIPSIGLIKLSFRKKKICKNKKSTKNTFFLVSAFFFLAK